MSAWTKAQVNCDGVTYLVKAFNQIGTVRSGETRTVLILNIPNTAPLFAAIVDVKGDTYRFVSTPKVMDAFEERMTAILLDHHKGPVTSEVLDLASGMCLACYKLNEVQDVQTTQVSQA